MYDVNYFINKFNSIPEHMMITCDQGIQEKEGNQPHCALGWCVNRAGYYGCAFPGGYLRPCNSEEAAALNDLLMQLPGLTSTHNALYPVYRAPIVNINNGLVTQYQQSTPKQRILAALEDVKRLQEQDEAVRVTQQIINKEMTITNNHGIHNRILHQQV